ncbi:hypothetical protein [Streptomyces clavuligerus]|uniref:Uncharacterized protein n=2 Tax=Streptomyces clavuligerus TaxID=1901 RepID=E2PZF9_STRCL|nr:hypothetical protein [Streptomyces clavuligerus]ANW17127.1 hypothetical protein BB341_02295 [Streptomyces clavuligerus]AXU11667.1 hypothetical protein D1794_02395 [Streptomyces clavuligerus]EFG10420.1 Hypothetical protein SCLAV_5353 [Streptomyces clavuligerus]MBY6301506.1 hypothetical protein [Streptomyces clavuligerus]QCS04447.1 hypothetical protein CRV15_01830 [Streptomyces clavuligerus]
MPTTDDISNFLALSSRLTGFDRGELEATGLVDVYRTVAAEQLGEERYGRLLRWAADRPDGETPRDGGDGSGGAPESARALAFLWYTGSWPGSPPQVVSPRAYAEGLVWKAVGVAAPGTGRPGHGSWAGPPAGVGGR